MNFGDKMLLKDVTAKTLENKLFLSILSKYDVFLGAFRHIKFAYLKSALKKSQFLHP
jgi:hypothetical protein